MKSLVNLCWKVLLPIETKSAASFAGSKLFNVLSGRRFARALGGNFQLENTPLVLAPTDLFHAALKERKLSLGAKGNRFPYYFEHSGLKQSISVNFTLHLHDRFLCLTIKLNTFEAEHSIDWVALQDLSAQDVIWPLARKILAITCTESGKGELSREPEVLRAIHIKPLDQDLQNWRLTLAALVTTHSGVSEEVATTVFEKNQPHQLDNTRLLLDKQGIAAYVPIATDSRGASANLARFENALSMLQLAAVLRKKLRAKLALSTDEEQSILDPKSSISESISGLKMWTLLINEFALRQKLVAQTPLNTPYISHEVTPQKSRPTTVKILLLSVTPPETKALYTALEAATGRKPEPKRIDGFTYQSFGKVGDFEVFHQISGMGSGGIDGSQEFVRRGIHAIRPDAVLMVGIAFGVDKEKQPIGTILVSKQIQTYELQRVNSDASITPRGDKVTASPKLLNWVAHAEIYWPDSGAKVKKGLVLSGEKLVDNEDFRDALLKIAPEAIGGEMEGAGVYAASQSEGVAWLLIKAVCDWADGNKSAEKAQLQAYAAKAAADFTIQVLKANSEQFP